MEWQMKLSTDNTKLDFEIKDFFSRYTNDVIATCAFGIKINSFEDRHNDFLVAGQELTDFTGPKAIARFLFMRAMPRLAKLFNVQFISAWVGKFFTKIFNETMDERKKRGIFRPDMINILMQVRYGKLSAESEAENVQKESAGFATVEESEIGKRISKRQ